MNMDQNQMRQALQQKVQNPRLIRIPLNLGKNFIQLSIRQKSQIQDVVGQGQAPQQILPQNQRNIQIQQILLKYEIILLFFGAQWCNITKGFVNLLKKYYQQINLQTKKIQIIYISLDKGLNQFQQFTSQMPWLGISYQDQRVKNLKQFYTIKSIPSLILVDSHGQQVQCDCRSDIYNLQQDQCFQKWKNLKNCIQTAQGVQIHDINQ